jgi:hypothetical protein
MMTKKIFRNGRAWIKGKLHRKAKAKAEDETNERKIVIVCCCPESEGRRTTDNSTTGPADQLPP